MILKGIVMAFGSEATVPSLITVPSWSTIHTAVIFNETTQRKWMRVFCQVIPCRFKRIFSEKETKEGYSIRKYFNTSP
jgi:hypothetical protein